MEVRAKDLKYKVLGMGLFWAPVFSLLVQEWSSLPNEGLVLCIIVCILLLLLSCFHSSVRLLLKRKNEFKKRYIYSHVIVLVASFMLPLVLSIIVTGALYVYIGFHGVKCLESL